MGNPYGREALGIYRTLVKGKSNIPPMTPGSFREQYSLEPEDGGKK